LITLGLVMVSLKGSYTIPSNSGTVTPRSKQSPFQAFKRIDFLGCFLLAGWVGAALIAISLKTNYTSVDAYDWTSPTLLGLYATSSVLLVVFLFVELKWAAEPVMLFELLKQQTPISVPVNNFVLSIVTFGTVSPPSPQTQFRITPRPNSVSPFPRARLPSCSSPPHAPRSSRIKARPLADARARSSTPSPSSSPSSVK
jgi:hypothetical protein